MLVLLLILLPFAAALLILVIRLLRPGFAFSWLVAMLTSLLSWILAWLVRPQAPLNLPLANWQPRIFLPISPALLLDLTSWPFVVALTTLLLATLATDVARPAASRNKGYGSHLAAYLLLTAFSILAVLSGNLLTLLLAWTLLAGVELALQIRAAQDGAQGRTAVMAFALRLAGIGWVVWAGMVAYAAGLPLSFTTISPQISHILLVAAGVNLGLLPLHSPISKDAAHHAGLLTLLRLSPSAPALVLLARVGLAGAPAHQESLFLLLAGWALIYAGLTWISASRVQAGLDYWAIGLAALAWASAARGQPDASLSWGVAGLFVGGLFGLSTTRMRGLSLLWLMALVSIAALPFSPTWAGAGLYALPFLPALAILLAGQSLLLAGTLRQALRLPPPLTGAERWVGGVYLAGLLLLGSSYLAAAWFVRPGAGVIGRNQVGWIETGISLLAPGLAILGTPFYLRRWKPQSVRLLRLAQFLELGWLYRLAGLIGRGLERAVLTAGTLLEGRAGILWTLLALALLVSLFASLGLGG